MGYISLPVRVLNCASGTIKQYLEANQPDALRTKEEIQAANKGKKRQVYDKSIQKEVRNPEYRTNTLQDEKNVCKDIAKLLWKDTAFQTALSKVKLKSTDKEIKTEKDLLAMMLDNAKGAPISNFNKYVTLRLRYERLSIPIVEAQKNEDNGLGPFQGCSEEEIKEMKDRIIAMLKGPVITSKAAKSKKKGKGKVKPVMTENEANAIIVEMLEQYSLEDIFHLTTAQMTAIILEYVKEENPHRKDELEQEIMEYREKNPDALHDQELNELAVHIDYIIKVKCSVTQTVPLLMSGEVIPLKLYDDDFDKPMLSMYTMVSLLL